MGASMESPLTHLITNFETLKCFIDEYIPFDFGVFGDVQMD